MNILTDIGFQQLNIYTEIEKLQIYFHINTKLIMSKART